MFLSVLGAHMREITTTHPYSLSSCSLKMGLFSELVLHTICGTKFGANLGLFWDSLWVPKSIQKQELILNLFRCPFWTI